MSQRDPDKPQLDFPQLTADIISELRLTGQVGLLDFLDEVRPVYIVSARGGSLPVRTTVAAFTSASITGSSPINPAANTIISDTGPLPAGDYDMYCNLTVQGTMNVSGRIEFQHRDAANTATLGILLTLGMTTTHQANSVQLPLIGYTLGLNERLRIIVGGGGVTGIVTLAFGFQLRPTP